MGQGPASREQTEHEAQPDLPAANTDSPAEQDRGHGPPARSGDHDTETESSNTELTMIIARPNTREWLRTWKTREGYSYDEAITHLLDAAPPADAVDPQDPETMPTLDTTAADGDYVNIAASVHVRDRLKLWKTWRDFTYDEALRYLLNTYTDIPR